MDFLLNEEQLMIQQTAKEFAAAEIAPTVIQRDKEAIFPTDIVKKLR